VRLQESKVLQGSGIILLVFSLVLLFIFIPAQIRDVTTFGVSPRFVPQILTVLLAFLSALLILEGFYTKRAENQKIYNIEGGQFKVVSITLAILCGYTWVVDLLGYIPTTMITIGVLMWLYGQRKLWPFFFITLFLPLAIYEFFTLLLQVQLP